MKALPWIIVGIVIAAAGIFWWTRRDYAPPLPEDKVSARALIDSLEQARFRRMGDSLAVISERIEAYRDSLKAARKPVKQRVNEASRTLDGAPLGVLVDTLSSEPVQ